MSNRRNRIGNPFDKPEQQTTTPDNSLLAVDSVMFSGDKVELETARQLAKPIGIFQIAPDPMQPRRAMPSEVRKFWQDHQGDIEAMFTFWYQTVQKTNPEFSLDHHMQPQPEHEQAEAEEPTTAQVTANPVEESFRELIALAVSIRRDGLTNPITIARLDEGHYQIETGERRWLAYHLLHLYFDGSDGRPDEHRKWDKIPACVVEKPSVWRQASENTARQDLNAIGRARQFALLLMDLLGQEGKHFRHFDETVTLESDRAFYAQVADAKAYRVPSGKNEVLLTAMGLSHRSQITHYRAMLSLPDEVWRLGDDYWLPEELLYNLSKLDEQSALEEIRKIVVAHNNLTEAVPIEEPAHQDKRKSEPPTVIAHQPGTNRHFAETTRTIAKTGPGKATQNQQALQYIEQLQAWLDEHRRRIMEYR